MKHYLLLILSVILGLAWIPMAFLISDSLNPIYYIAPMILGGICFAIYMWMENKKPY